MNNRTHREILVVDGTVAFAGGAGFADQWLYTEGDDRRWRDTMVGARIFEYQPSMIHAKVLLVDRKFAVVGSTNLDARSFGLNDEVNLALPDQQ